MLSVASSSYTRLRKGGNGTPVMQLSTIPTNKSNTVKRVTKRHILTQVLLLQRWLHCLQRPQHYFLSHPLTPLSHSTTLLSQTHIHTLSTHILDIRARETITQLTPPQYIALQSILLLVHTEYRLATLRVGRRNVTNSQHTQHHSHQLVETTRTQQSVVNHLGTVRRPNHQHTPTTLHAIHLRQKRRHHTRLYHVVASTHTSLTHQRVDLVQKHDRRCRRSSTREQ